MVKKLYVFLYVFLLLISSASALTMIANDNFTRGNAASLGNIEYFEGNTIAWHTVSKSGTWAITNNKAYSTGAQGWNAIDGSTAYTNITVGYFMNCTAWGGTDEDRMAGFYLGGPASDEVCGVGADGNGISHVELHLNPRQGTDYDTNVYLNLNTGYVIVASFGMNYGGNSKATHVWIGNVSDPEAGFQKFNTSVACASNQVFNKFAAFRTMDNNPACHWDSFILYNGTPEEYETGFEIMLGKSQTPPALPVDNINLSEPEPINYPYYNTNIHTLNASANVTTEFSLFNASLYLSVNGAAYNLNASKLITTGLNANINFTLTLPDGNISYYINGTVRNGAGVGSYNDSEQTAAYNFVIDTASPIETTDFINKSSYVGRNITGSFNYSDSIGLHSFNISIDGIPIFNITGIGAYTYNYTLNYDPSGLTPGFHTLTTYRADGHTAQELLSPEDYNPTNGLFNDYMKYNFRGPYKKGFVKMEGLPGSLFDTFTTEQYKDRYKIIYKPFSLSSSYSFKITTSDKITVYNSLEYGGDWAVFGEHWIDFYIPDEPNLNVIINKLNDYEAEVFINGINPTTQKLNFNSVGDLNTVTESYQVFIGNATATWEEGVIGAASQTITLNLTTGTGITTAANLIYNGTWRTATKSSGADYDFYTSTFTTPVVPDRNASFNFTWNYSVTGPVNTEVGDINESNTGYNYFLDNCTSFHTSALNVSFINLSSDKSVSVDVTLSVEGTANYSATFNKIQNFSLCIYPSFGNLSEAFTIQYDAGTSYYFNDDYYLTSNTQNLNLYTQSATETTTFTVKNRDTGATLEDTYATMYRRINGTFTVIEAKYTDITGRVQFGFDPTAEYQFFLSKNSYDPYTFILNPIIFDSYDILMDPSFISNQTWDYDRIGLLHQPEVFYNDQLNNFTFNIHSPYEELLNYRYTLTFPGGNSPLSNSGASAVGEELTSTLNISGATLGDKVYLDYRYETDLAGIRVFSYEYQILMEGNNTIIRNRDRTFGLGLFARLFISVFFVFLFVGIATLVGQPVAGFGLGLLLYGYFVYIGFIPIWSVLITIAIGLLIVGSRPDG